MFKTSLTKESIILGKWIQEELNRLFCKSSRIKSSGKRIEFLSSKFLGAKYTESTLIGDINTPEVFVINLEGVDCFTFIDYIEAMRLSEDFIEFKNNLKKVRYKSGIISFKNRNHFFTDWREFNSDLIDDVTYKIGGRKTKRVYKILNEKEDRTSFLQGIKPVHREIRYIPSGEIDDSVINKLRTGDYIGVYSNQKGLDVSHVGIIIKDKNKIFLRHASSQKQHRKVIDEDLKAYIADKPGIIILRPK